MTGCLILPVLMVTGIGYLRMARQYRLFGRK